MKMDAAWCVIVLRDDGAFALIESAWGPLSKEKAHAWANQFNEEYDGSPWKAQVRPLTQPLEIS